MKYTLTTPKGNVFTFFVEALARTYQQVYGGTLAEVVSDQQPSLT